MIEIRAVQKYRTVDPKGLVSRIFGKPYREVISWRLQYREVIDENTATPWRTVECFDEAEVSDEQN